MTPEERKSLRERAQEVRDGWYAGDYIKDCVYGMEDAIAAWDALSGADGAKKERKS